MKNTVIKSILIGLSLAVITIAAFWGVQRHEFVNYDDEDYVFENQNVQHGFTGKAIQWAFTESHASNWHPITWLSHMLDCRLFGLNPGRHHAVNLLIHILNVLLFFWILKDTTGAIWKSAIAACLFAIHPLRVESVAWVAERKDVLSALFWMLTTIAYIRYSRRPGAIRYFGVLLLFALGLMSKPMIVTLPFVLLLMDYWPLERLQTNAQAAQGNSKTKSISGKQSPLYLLAEKIPLFLLAAISSVITFMVQQKGGAMDIIDRLSFASRLANAAISYIVYIQKMVWPSALAPFYPHSADRVPFALAVAAAILILAASILVIRFGKDYKYLPVGWFWYLGTLVPVIGLIQVGEQAYADRYSYIPMTGLIILIIWLVPQLVSKWIYKNEILCTCSLMIIAAFSICTYIQQQYWRDSITLFDHAIKVTKDNYVAHYCIADPLRAKGRLKEAIAHNAECLRIRPYYDRALNSMGLALIETGEFDEAIKDFNLALKINPYSYQVHTNLGMALSKKGRFDDAIAQYREALSHTDMPRIHANLAVALQSKGEKEAALEEYTRALAADPSNELVHYEVGVLFAEQGKNDRAAAHLRSALEIKPNFVEAHNSLGYILAHEGKYDEAIRHYNEALRIEHNSAVLHINLAFVFVSQGKFDLAAKEYEQALSLQPENYVAHNYLGVVLFRLGNIRGAMNHFNQALKLNPDYTDARNSIQAIKPLLQNK
jgi:protein O-mannosyl-transferase